MKERFFLCRHCGNLVGMINDAGVSLVCCGEKMEALVPKTTQTGHEKHLPGVEVKENVVQVKVGSVGHPMAEDHRIEWVYLHTQKGGQRRSFSADDKPEVRFVLDADEPIAVYAYCNLHGLWVAPL